MQHTRRRVVRGIATGGVAIAGCLGSGGGGDGGEGGAGGDSGDGSGGGDGGGSGGGGTQSSGGGEADATVEMVETSFDPVRISVPTGGTVAWVNRDGFDHDVTAARFHDAAADWSFSQTLAGDERTSHTFEDAGVYEYYCTIHGEGSMCGAVLVGDASLDGSLPCESGGGDGGTTSGGGSGDGGGGYY